MLKHRPVSISRHFSEPLWRNVEVQALLDLLTTRSKAEPTKVFRCETIKTLNTKYQDYVKTYNWIS